MLFRSFYYIKKYKKLFKNLKLKKNNFYLKKINKIFKKFKKQEENYILFLKSLYLSQNLKNFNQQLMALYIRETGEFPPVDHA